MNILFRTDASLEIGTGHVMRCLALADALRAHGGQCHFICREHRGHLVEQIRSQGHTVNTLRCEPDQSAAAKEKFGRHDAWLGSTPDRDAQDTVAIATAIRPDWLILDHYALDRLWERTLRPHCGRLMVIDDLADRSHECDVLLDQNLGRTASDYAALVPARCTVLAGAQYALLRPQFAALREQSLRRRAHPELKHLLITMGGVDRSNVTGQVLESLRSCRLPQDCRVTVVMGPHAPWLEQVQAVAANLPWPVAVKVNISDMAQLMTESDLAIGAAGTTSWERCCLGLPALIVVLADNQRPLARALEESGAALQLDFRRANEFAAKVETSIADFVAGRRSLKTMSEACASVTSGNGTNLVTRLIAGIKTL